MNAHQALIERMLFSLTFLDHERSGFIRLTTVKVDGASA